MARAGDAAFGGLSFRQVSPDPQVVCFRYLVEVCPDADGFLTRAAAAGIQCRRPVFRPLHLTIGGRCPESERRHRAVVSVPMYPALTGSERERILSVLPPLLAAG